MITTTDACNIAQNVNRNAWLNAAEFKIDALIQRAALSGLRTCIIPLETCIQGAENLEEAAELLSKISRILNNYNYKHKITIDGTLYITW